MTEAEYQRLDHRMATEVLGYVVAPSHCCGLSGFGYHPDDRCPACEFVKPTGQPWLYPSEVPPYSRDTAASIQVVEALRQESWLVTMKAMPAGFPFRASSTDEPIPYRYVVETMWMPLRTVGDMRRSIHARCVGMADTLALAVCRCALECIDARKRFPVSEPRGDGH
jgi:hypothetical protein